MIVGAAVYENDPAVLMLFEVAFGEYAGKKTAKFWKSKKALRDFNERKHAFSRERGWVDVFAQKDSQAECLVYWLANFGIAFVKVKNNEAIITDYDPERFDTWCQRKDYPTLNQKLCA